MHKAFCEFIWDSPKNKISRLRMTKDYKEGGLRYVDIEEFWGCLKLTWIRRVGTSECTWEKLFKQELMQNANVNSEALTSMEDIELQEVGNTLNSKLWTQTLHTLGKVRIAFLKSNTTRLWKCSPFKNSFFTKPGKLPKHISKHWDQKDLPLIGEFVQTLSDLRNNSGKIMTLAEFKEHSGGHPNFTTFGAFRNTLHTNLVKNHNEKKDDHYQSFHHFVTCKKGTNRFRKALSIERKPVTDTKFPITTTWKLKLNIDWSHWEWQKAFRGWFTLPISATHRAFQLRILNRIIGCGHYLKKTNCPAKTRCRLCLQKNHINDETIEHLFVDCNITKAILEELKSWEPLKKLKFTTDHSSLLIWSRRDTIFEETAINAANIFVKHYIWLCQMKPKLPTLPAAKAYLKYNAKCVSNSLQSRNLPDPLLELGNAEM